MPDKDRNGLLSKASKYLNGHKTSILSVIAGVLLFVFAAGGSWYQIRAEITQVKRELDHYQDLKDDYVSRHELDLNLKPLNDKIESVQKSVEEIKRNQRTQNEQILQELRRLNSDG